MRSPRAYLAAFGTSGSLLAVAALAFVFASAYVSVRGFPQVSAAGSPTSVTITPPPRAPVSRVARRLSVVLGPSAAAPRAPAKPGARAAVPAAARPGPTGPAPGSPAAPRHAGASASGPHAAGAVSRTGAASRRAPSGGSSRSPANPAGQVAGQVAGQAGRPGRPADGQAGRLGRRRDLQQAVGSLPAPAGGAAGKAAPPSVTP